MNDFEKQLQRQPLRKVPPEWREEILSAAANGQAPRPTPHASPPPWWQQLLWPCPQAWAGLAALWLVVFGLHVASRTSEPRGLMVAKVEAAPSPQVLALLREQRALCAELLGRPETAPPPVPPRPRSERTTDCVAV